MLVVNQANVLTRVVSMFGRRGFNIDSLTVSATNDPNLSRITIVFSATEQSMQKIITQTEKLEVVKDVFLLNRENSLYRELLLIKVRNDPAVRGDIRSASDAYEGKVVDYTKESIMIQMVGDSRKIDNFINLMRDFEILEICRTGIVTLQRGSTTIRRVTNL